MSIQQKKTVMLLCIAIGIFAVLIVVLKAHAAEVMCDNNILAKENSDLRGQVERLDLKVKSANSVEHLEEIATKKLGMSYPNKGECIYLSKEKAPNQDLAVIIKEKAYN